MSTLELESGSHPSVLGESAPCEAKHSGQHNIVCVRSWLDKPNYPSLSDTSNSIPCAYTCCDGHARNMDIITVEEMVIPERRIHHGYVENLDVLRIPSTNILILPSHFIPLTQTLSTTLSQSRSANHSLSDFFAHVHEFDEMTSCVIQAAPPCVRTFLTALI